jgi:hypothetical protein
MPEEVQAPAAAATPQAGTPVVRSADQGQSPPVQAADVPGDERARVEKLSAELEKAQRDLAAAGGETVMLRVGGPHESMSYGGLTVGSEPTPVPVRHLPALETAAADAGVELIRED